MLPEPWQSASTDVKNEYAHTLQAFGNMEQLQQTRNALAIEAGNKALSGISSPLGKYNGDTKRYWLNGGPSNTFGFVLPGDPAGLHLEQYYPAAQNACVRWDPAQKINVPTGEVTETPIWSLPPGTVLYIVQP